MLSRSPLVAAPLREELKLATSLRKYGGDERIMERERQIESFLTQSGLTDAQRHAALRDLRATHAMRTRRSVSVYAGTPRIWARISSYLRMAGDRWEPANEEDSRQLKQVEKDFELTKEEFKDAATNKAYGVLQASAQVIFDSLGQFGITDPTPVQSAIIAVHIGGKSHESQAALWLDKAKQVYGDAYERRGAVTTRDRFAKQVDALMPLQQKVTKAAVEEFKARKQTAGVMGALDMTPAKRGKKNRPKDPAHAAAWDKLQEARRELDVAWLDTERAHPALAAYRERGEDLASIDLGKKGMSGDARLRHTLAPIVEKLVNVHEAINALKQGKLKPMSLRPVVRATRADLLIPEGSTFDPAVQEGIEEAGETSWAMKIIDAVMFAMSFTGIGGIAAGAYDLLKEYVKYESDKRLSNTALDATKSISDVDPSLTGLILAAVDLGMSINEVRSVLKEARQLKKAMLEEGDEAARKALDELGERHGVNDLAEQVEKREKPKAKAASEHPKDPHAEDLPTSTHGGPSLPSVPIPSREREEFRAQLRGALKSAQPNGVPGDGTEWSKLEFVLKGGIEKSPANDAMLAELRKMHATVRDPDAIVKAADDLLEKARAAGKSPEKYLAEHYGGRLPVLTTQKPKDFWKQAAEAKPFVDKTFADSSHGSFVHVFQMYVLDHAHGPGAATKFRQNLVNVTGKVKLPSDEIKDLRDLVWDAVFDEYNAGNLNAPEILGPILNQHLGFNRTRKKKP